MTLELAKQLIAHRSITPEDGGCQDLIGARLEQAGFRSEHLRFGDVSNLWLTHGHGAPLLVFLGHTDVVPTGPESEWNIAPFSPTVRNGVLYGRGAADMKGSVAAMVTALERFGTEHAGHRGTVALLLTSDEEGMALNGTRRVMETLSQRGIRIDWCVVGEPSARERLGDVIKNGRRGSLTGELTVLGVQGHVAYPEIADNPIHRALAALQELATTEWDRGNEHYPPTSFQISNINAGTGADNVIPGSLRVLFNFRYSTCLTRDQIVHRVESVLERHGLRFRLEWRPPSLPFLTQDGALLDAVRGAVREHTGLEPELSTSGGTSDGRFVAPTGAEVVEIGPVNATIHKINECVSVEDLETLSVVFGRIAEKLLA